MFLIRPHTAQRFETNATHVNLSKIRKWTQLQQSFPKNTDTMQSNQSCSEMPTQNGNTKRAGHNC